MDGIDALKLGLDHVEEWKGSEAAEAGERTLGALRGADAALDELAAYLYADPEEFPSGADVCEVLAQELGRTGRTPANTETEQRLDGARQWLDDIAVPRAVLDAMQPEAVRDRVRGEYPSNTPGQDGWTSFCEDWAEGSLAATEPTA